jgi:hypothetical protein
MRTLRSVSVFAAIVGLAAGCGTTPATPPTPDATPDVAAEAGPDDAAEAGADVAPDRARPPMAPSDIYGPCNADAECVDGLTCNTEAMTGFPGGQCNRTCTSDDDCVLRPSDGSAPVDGWCRPSVNGSPRVCARVCANGIDCEREGYTCRQFNPGALNQVSACVAVCTEASCVNGTTCNNDTGLCRSAGSTPSGRGLGQSCEPSMRPGSPPPPADQQCRSQLCNAEWNPDSRGNRFYTGYNGGYCISRCILPAGYNSSDFFPGTMLPRANCPEGGVCFPERTLTRGDPGVCFKSCTTNADCRASEGYFCQRRVQLSATNVRNYQNGYCIPINCANMATPCPMGFTCRRNAAGTAGACIPSSAAP